jgi:pimeloyl-ACP methyl ester carboxylesterase
VIDFLNEKTFHAFPENPVPLDIRREFRTLDGARHGGDIYSFVSETDWRLRLDIRWRQPESQTSPTVLVLRSPDESRWASVSFVSALDDRYNVAYLETRGVGANGWSTGLQWHVRRAAAWAGRTVASMQVYDVLRALETLRQIHGVSENEIVIAARDGMAAVALYAALLDGNVAGVILDSPPATQNAPGREDGRDFALEMLNCLRITDVPQVAGLLYPSRIAMVGDIPDTYQWAENLYKSLGEAENFQIIGDLSEY